VGVPRHDEVEITAENLPEVRLTSYTPALNFAALEF